MDLGDSKQVLKAAFETSDILNRALESLRASVPNDEFEKLQLSFAKVLGEILTELINPMVKLHPALKSGNTIKYWTALGSDGGARKPEDWL